MAKRTSEAALSVAQEALSQVQALESGSPVVFFVLVILLGYVYFVNFYLVQKSPGDMKVIMDIYGNKMIRSVVVSLILLGMSGMFGHAMKTISVMLAFVFVATYITLKHLLPDHKEGFTEYMAGMPGTLPGPPQGPPGQYPLGYPDPKCLPCSNGSANQMFNPQPYRPDDSVLGIGDPDQLPPAGVDFLSDPPGVYTQSGIAYEFGLA